MKLLKVLNRDEHKIKTVKINGFKIDVITAKECKKKAFYGDIDFGVRKKDSIDSVSIDDEEVFIAKPESLSGTFEGCVETEDGKLIRIIKYKKVPVFLFVLAGLIVVGLGVLALPRPDNGGIKKPWLVDINKWLPDNGPTIDIDNPDIPEGFTIDDGLDDWDGTLPVSGEITEASAESTIMPGYADIVLTESIPSIQLINPTGNTVYMVYTIKDGDKEIFKSDGIAPGKMKLLDLYHMLDKGEYKLKFTISTYDVDNFSVCNGVNQTVKVTIK